MSGGASSVQRAGLKLAGSLPPGRPRPNVRLAMFRALGVPMRAARSMTVVSESKIRAVFSTLPARPRSCLTARSGGELIQGAMSVGPQGAKGPESIASLSVAQEHLPHAQWRYSCTPSACTPRYVDSCEAELDVGGSSDAFLGALLKVVTRYSSPAHTESRPSRARWVPS